MGANASLPERVYDAASKGELQKLQKLAHELDLDPQFRDPEVRRAAVDWRDSDGRNSLMVAATKGRYEVAKELLAFGADVHAINTRYQNTGTALHEAVIYGCIKLVTLLLQAGANPFLANADGLTAFEEASERKRYKLLKRMEECALFAGNVAIKCSSYAGLKVSYKQRWVVIVEHMAYGDQPGVMHPPRMWIFKDGEACVPKYQCSLAGATVQTLIGDLGCDGIVGLNVAREPGNGLITPIRDGKFCLLIKPISGAVLAINEYYRFLDLVYNSGKGIRTVQTAAGAAWSTSLPGREPSMTQGSSGPPSPMPGTSNWNHYQTPQISAGSVTDRSSSGVGMLPPQSPRNGARRHSAMSLQSSLPSMGVVMEEDTIMAAPGESDEAFAARLATLAISPHNPAVQNSGSSAPQSLGFSRAAPGTSSATATSPQHTSAPSRLQPASFTSPHQQQQQQQQQPFQTPNPHRTTPTPNGNPFWDLIPEAERQPTLLHDSQAWGLTSAQHSPAVSQFGGGIDGDRSSSQGRSPSAPPMSADIGKTSSDLLQDDMLCIICLSAPRSAGFLHGATVHKCVCADCSTQIAVGQLCPLCRAPIERIIMSVYE